MKLMKKDFQGLIALTTKDFHPSLISENAIRELKSFKGLKFLTMLQSSSDPFLTRRKLVKELEGEKKNTLSSQNIRMHLVKLNYELWQAFLLSIERHSLLYGIKKILLPVSERQCHETLWKPTNGGFFLISCRCE